MVLDNGIQRPEYGGQKTGGGNPRWHTAAYADDFVLIVRHQASAEAIKESDRVCSRRSETQAGMDELNPQIINDGFIFLGLDVPQNTVVLARYRAVSTIPLEKTRNFNHYRWQHCYRQLVKIEVDMAEQPKTESWSHVLSVG